MTLTPSYGRDYTNKRSVLEDWNAGKDFTIADMFSGNCGRQVNKADLQGKSLYKTVNIRYKNLTQICVVKL